MIKRRLEDEVRERLQNSPSVALLGPRQVGKTTLAFALSENLPSIYLDLENRTDLRKVQDMEAFHRANRNKLIILDEVQRLPDVFAPVRGLIDAERRKGNKSQLFLFLGSASIELLRQSSESLAGRISYIELFPVDVLEFLQDPKDLDALNRLWLRGGFPESLLAKDDANSLRWRLDFIKTYLERDIPALGPRVPAETLERLWSMLAHAQGTNLNASKLATSLDVSSVTVGRYIDLLVDLLLVRKLSPYTTNIKKRLVKSPRVYVRDSGITHALLNIGTYNDLLGHPVVGQSWEGFVIENILAVLPQGAQAFYYRTSGGAEIDLVLELPGNPRARYAVEIKRSPAAAVQRGFHEACADINPTHKFVIHAQNDVFPMKHDIQATGLFAFMELITKG
ncbi:MAG: ATP-binding protein [Xanthomonadales bacterium]|nr:ATP-binding protein [Xanthomonadales bacterium]